MTAQSNFDLRSSIFELRSRIALDRRSKIEDPILAELVEELIAQLQAGRFVQPALVARDHPEYEEKLLRLLPALQALAGAAATSHAQADSPTQDHPLPFEKLGDYRLIREIGRGGMGVVYEAEQVSLSRRVAVKILALAAALDPRQRQRFLNEARAASWLHHANIVPVFGVGCEQGVHYYVMQYIDGHTLARVISELRKSNFELRASSFDLRSRTAEDRRSKTNLRPSTFDLRPSVEDRRSSKLEPRSSTLECLTTERSIRTPGFFRAVATIGIQAAEALEYAHQGGLIHRDIKPANLLIDQRGSLWITDFGLARLPGDTGLTQTGDMLGTLRYMSPEQAQTRRGVVDHRADVYSLGVTLYELLTLRPLFDEQNRAQLLNKILNDEPTPPRGLNRAVPVELETIVLKAVAKSPADRYATAQEMANDLSRFLTDKPVLARRPSLVERTGKWLRRHRAVVRTAAIFAAIGVLLLACGTVYLAQKRAEAEWGRQQARKAVDEMYIKRAEAEWRRQQARKAVDEMYIEVAEKWLATQPYREPLQHEFLLKALAFYEEFSKEAGGSHTARLEAALAFRRVGDIQRRLGETEKAKAAYSEAKNRLEAMSAERPQDPQSQAELAALLNQRGDLYRIAGDLQEALQSHEQALALFAELAAQYPDEADYRFGLAGSNNNLGLVLQGLHERAGAEKAFNQAIRVFRELVHDQPQVPVYWHFLALAHANLAVLDKDEGRLKDAEKESYIAIGLWRKLLDANPTFPPYRQGQGVNYLTLGAVLEKTKKPEEASEAYRLAVLLLEKLRAEFPLVPIYAEQSRDARTLLESLKEKSKGAHS